VVYWIIVMVEVLRILGLDLGSINVSATAFLYLFSMV